jgi:hypothetical protein
MRSNIGGVFLSLAVLLVPARLLASDDASGVTLISETRVEGLAVDVYVANGFAFVSAINGIEIFDLADRGRPEKVTRIDSNDEYWNDAWVKGTTLYVSSDTSGVVAYDVSDARAPIRIGSFPAGESINVHTTFIDGDLLFANTMAPNGEVLIFDIANPASPRLLSRFRARGADGWDFLAHDSFLWDRRLYVNQWKLGYVVVDLTDPGNPVELGLYPCIDRIPSHANAVGVFGNRIIAFEGTEGYTAHLSVLDVTDPGNIQLIGEYRRDPEISIHNMILVGTKLYVSHYQDGLRILDVSNPSKPAEIGYYDTYPDRHGGFDLQGAVGIRVPGDGYLYVADSERGLMVLQEQSAGS